VAVAVGLALLIQAFIVKPYRIPSPSMVPTLDIGQRVLTNRLDTTPSIGDIVVFHPPHGADNTDNPVCGNPHQGAGHTQACGQPTPTASSQTFIKRVVAGPGACVRKTPTPSPAATLLRALSANRSRFRPAITS
jgi:signal peptidase I